MSTPYLGKLSKDDKKFFGSRKEGKAIKDSERVKREEKKPQPNLNIRGQYSG